MSLLKLIASYDAEREAYITDLENEILDLKKKYNEALRLAVSGTQALERERLRAIMAGAYDKPLATGPVFPQSNPSE